ATLPAAALDVSEFGAELRQLAGGTTIVTLAQRGGAATDLALRAARCALRFRDARAGWRIVLATRRGVPSRGIHIPDAAHGAAPRRRAGGGRRGGAIWLDGAPAGLLGARFRGTRRGPGLVLDGEEQTLDPTRPLLGRPTACIGREHELAVLELALRVSIEES